MNYEINEMRWVPFKEIFRLHHNGPRLGAVDGEIGPCH